MGGSSSVTIGYKYYMGFHAIICHGPVDEVQTIIVAEKEAWSGNVSTTQQIFIDKPNLFGGEKKEGGIRGYVDVELGLMSQPKNDYLMTQLGPVIPAFRGVLGLVVRKAYLAAMSPYIKPWAVRVKRIPAKDWYAAKSDINGSANPAHIIYECLTSEEWGMGAPASQLDLNSFTAAADTLFTEGLGVSLMLTNPETVEKFIYEVLGHCNGILYTAQADGRFTLKLLRDDYDVGTLPLFDPSNILKFNSFSRPSYAEIVNEIVVKYQPRGDVKQDSIVLQDLAAIQAQGGVISQSVNYPGIDNADNAARVGMRDLRQRSTPFANVKITVNRQGWQVGRGEVFKLTWPDHGFSETPFRVIKIDLGDQRKSSIVIDAVEDVFGLDATTYVNEQANLWTDPIAPAGAFSTKVAEEATYWDLVHIYGEDGAEITENNSYAAMTAAELPAYISDLELWTKPVGGVYALDGTGGACVWALLSTNIGELDTTINISGYSSNTKLTLRDASPAWAGGDTVTLDSYAYIGSEIIRVDSADLVANTLTVGRGCLDTVPTSHSINEQVIFSELGKTFGTTPYLLGDSLDMKALPSNGTTRLPLASDTAGTVPIVSRQGKPYPPKKFRINGAAYPATVLGDDPITITGAERNRFNETGRPMLDESAASISPESGVFYHAEAVNASNSAVLESVSGLLLPSYTFSAADVLNDTQSVKLSLWSSRGGIECHQRNIHTVTRVDGGGLPITAGFTPSADTIISAGGVGTTTGTTLIPLYSDGVTLYGYMQETAPTTTANLAAIVTRFYSTTDGVTFNYLGSQGGTHQELEHENGVAVGGSFTVALPKYLVFDAVPPTQQDWYSVKTTTLADSYPLDIWTDTQPLPWAIDAGQPVCIVWDAANTRFVSIRHDNLVQQSTDGVAWTQLGFMTIAPYSSFTLTAQSMPKLAKSGSYWYLFNPRTFEGARVGGSETDQQVLRSTDLLSWENCPGTGLATAAGMPTLFEPNTFAVGATVMIVTARADVDANTNTGNFQSISRATDGYQFTQVSQTLDSLMITELVALPNDIFVGATSSGVYVSTGLGVLWAHTVLSQPPHRMRAVGSAVVALRKTKNGNMEDELWTTTNGVDWSLVLVAPNVANMTHRHWRFKISSNPVGDVTTAIVEIGFFNGATKQTGYTKTQGSGSNLANIDDGLNTTWWSTVPNNVVNGTAWVALDFSTARTITALEVEIHPTTTANAPRAVEIEYSDDGTTWNPAWFETNLIWTNGENKRLEAVL